MHQAHLIDNQPFFCRRYKTKRRIRLASEMIAVAALRKYPVLSQLPPSDSKVLSNHCFSKIIFPNSGELTIDLIAAVEI